MPEGTVWFDRWSAPRSVRPWALLVVAGALLFLPLLGRYGLWDPHEVRVAEAAREMAHTHSWTVPARFANKPLLLLEAIAVGYRYLGTGEVAGRLPVALMSLAALLACFYAGSGLLRGRAALLGALALLTMPVFSLGARQLTSAVAPILATTLAVGGLARAAWPSRGGSPLPHLLLGLVGLGLGQAAAGFGLGVAVPLLAVAAALWLYAPAAAAASSEGALAGEAREPSSSLTLPRVAFGLLAVAALVLTAFGWWRGMPAGGHPGFSWIVGGTPHAASHQIQATTVLKQVGFGAFPWIVVAPLAVARLFAPADGAGEDRPSGSDELGRYVLVAWALLAYLGTTLFTASVADTTYGGYAAIALLAGAFLGDVLEASAPQTVAALVVIAGAATISHDFFMAPEGFAGAHVLEGIKWPAVVTAPAWILLFGGLLWGVVTAAALVVPRPHRRLLPSPAALVLLAVGTSLALTVFSVYWMVPEVSKHLSMKGLFVKYKSIVGTGESAIGKYHVPGQLSDYGKTTDLATLPQMFDFLARSDRVFVISASDDLPAIDQYAKQRGREQPEKPVVYYVIDDSNSKFLMISNQLGSESDKNPLRRFVLPVSGGLPREPQHPLHADFEGKVELLGFDLPAEVDRGHPFKIALFYKVNAPIPGGQRIFIHFDGSGSRFNGDHTPLDGKFPTNYWVPGFYVIDEFTVTPERLTQPSGIYTVYTGFWSSDQRLKAVSGPSDGDNRVKLGFVRVR